MAIPAGSIEVSPPSPKPPPRYLQNADKYVPERGMTGMMYAFMRKKK
ncbi:MAG: hypothetical protein WBK88_08100 [Methanothrix sp.]